jgi:hypothetical protein
MRFGKLPIDPTPNFVYSFRAYKGPEILQSTFSGFEVPPWTMSRAYSTSSFPKQKKFAKTGKMYCMLYISST